MTDLILERLADANPVRKDDLTPSFESVWTSVREADSPPPTRRPVWSRRRFQSPRPLLLGGVASVLTATVLAMMLVSAGSAPTAAQAFPILKKPAVDISAKKWYVGSSSQTAVIALPAPSHRSRGALLSFGHPFAAPYGHGYVAANANRKMLCLVLIYSYVRVLSCNTTAHAERYGLLLDLPLNTRTVQFLALVPAGGTVDLAFDGATHKVPVTANGITSGVVHEKATVSLHVGAHVRTVDLTPGRADFRGRTRLLPPPTGGPTS